MDHRSEIKGSRIFEDNLVSVIMPVYNAEKYLDRTIQSVLSQDYKNIEMILVNDCSSDNSQEIIQQYQEQANIRCFMQKKNMGAAVARNKALSLAKGRYVAFLDSDDMWQPDKIKKQLYILKKRNVGFCFTAIEIIDGSDKIIKGKRKIKRWVDYKYLLHNTVIPTSSVLIDRNVFGDFRMPLRRGGQDYATWLMLLRDGAKAYGINEPLTQYRIDGKSLSSNKLNSIRQIWEIQTNNEGISKIEAFIDVICFVINATKKYFFNQRN